MPLCGLRGAAAIGDGGDHALFLESVDHLCAFSTYHNCNRKRLCAEADSVSVTVGQMIRRHGRKEMWDSVGVYAEEDRDGTLLVRVVVFNPDWDEPLQIACIRSRPQDKASEMALGCNLDHVGM